MIAALVCLVALSGCARGPGRREVPTARLVRGELVEQVLLTGDLEAVEATPILAPQTPEWRVQVIELFPDGEVCEKGDVILRFDPTGLLQRQQELELMLVESEDKIENQEAALEEQLRALELEESQARAEYRKAELDASVMPGVRSDFDQRAAELKLRRASIQLGKLKEERRLRKEEGEADIALLEVQLTKIRSEMEFVEKGLEQLTIRAPQEGLVVVEWNWQEGRKFEAGDSSWPGMTILQIPDMREMRVEAWAHELDASRIEPGQPAEVVPDMYPERTLKGRVQSIANAPEPKRRRSRVQLFEVEVELEETDAEWMRPGMSARVRVAVSRRPEVLLLPREALFLEGEERVVYVTSGDGRFLRRPVVTGARNARYHAVLDGLEAGERVALRRPHDG